MSSTHKGSVSSGIPFFAIQSYLIDFVFLLSIILSKSRFFSAIVSPYPFRSPGLARNFSYFFYIRIYALYTVLSIFICFFSRKSILKVCTLPVMPQTFKIDFCGFSSIFIKFRMLFFILTGAVAKVCTELLPAK